MLTFAQEHRSLWADVWQRIESRVRMLGNVSVPHDAAGLSSRTSATSAFEMVLKIAHPKHD